MLPAPTRHLLAKHDLYVNQPAPAASPTPEPTRATPRALLLCQGARTQSQAESRPLFITKNQAEEVLLISAYITGSGLGGKSCSPARPAANGRLEIELGHPPAPSVSPSPGERGQLKLGYTKFTEWMGFGRDLWRLFSTTSPTKAEASTAVCPAAH